LKAGSSVDIYRSVYTSGDTRLPRPPKHPPRGLREDQQRYHPPQTAKLFKNGRSQAVRLPKEFRFEGDEVYVRREGRSIVLSPKERSRKDQWKDFFAALDMFDPTFRFERDQPKQQQIRQSLDAPAAPPRRRTKRRP